MQCFYCYSYYYCLIIDILAIIILFPLLINIQWNYIKVIVKALLRIQVYLLVYFSFLSSYSIMSSLSLHNYYIIDVFDKCKVSSI